MSEAKNELMKYGKQISDGLKKARKAASLTQEEAAGWLGAERKTIWYWESGNAIMPLVYARLLSEEDPRARSILGECLGTKSEAPKELSEDTELWAVLSKARKHPNWHVTRWAVLGVIAAGLSTLPGEAAVGDGESE